MRCSSLALGSCNKMKASNLLKLHALSQLSTPLSVSVCEGSSIVSNGLNVLLGRNLRFTRASFAFTRYHYYRYFAWSI